MRRTPSNGIRLTMRSIIQRIAHGLQLCEDSRTAPFLGAVLDCGVPALTQALDRLRPMLGVPHRQVLAAAGIAVVLSPTEAAAHPSNPGFGRTDVDQETFGRVAMEGRGSVRATVDRPFSAVEGLRRHQGDALACGGPHGQVIEWSGSGRRFILRTAEPLERPAGTPIACLRVALAEGKAVALCPARNDLTPYPSKGGALMKAITLAAALALLALGGPLWAAEPAPPSASQAGEVTTPPPDTSGTPAGTGDQGSGTATASTGDC